MSFNDDDFYVFWEDTKKLAYRVGCKSPRPTPLPGQIVVTGMRARHLGLEI